MRFRRLLHAPESCSRSSASGLLLLRVGVSAYMLTHGIGKMSLVLSGEWTVLGDPIGLGPEVSLFLITGAELIAPCLVAIGFLTSLASVPIVLGMCVGGFLAHAGDPWTMEAGAAAFASGAAASWGSKEPALIYALIYSSIVLTGPGRYSIDWMMLDRRGIGLASSGAHLSPTRMTSEQ